MRYEKFTQNGRMISAPVAIKDIFPATMSALVGGVCGRRDHLVPDRGLRQLIRRHIEFDELSDAPIPLDLSPSI